MSTPTTPEQARDFAQSIFDDGAPDDEVELIRSLAEQVETLTAERDEWKARRGFSFEQRDKLTAERYALKDAARLALDALEEAHKYAYNIGKYLHGVPQAITALKAVL